MATLEMIYPHGRKIYEAYSEVNGQYIWLGVEGDTVTFAGVPVTLGGRGYPALEDPDTVKEEADWCRFLHDEEGLQAVRINGVLMWSVDTDEQIEKTKETVAETSDELASLVAALADAMEEEEEDEEE